MAHPYYTEMCTFCNTNAQQGQCDKLIATFYAKANYLTYASKPNSK